MRRNYYRKFSGEIITENYQLVYQSRGKCEIYRDTGVFKNTSLNVKKCCVFISRPNLFKLQSKQSYLKICLLERFLDKG